MIILSFTCIFNISQAYREKNICNNLKKRGASLLDLLPLSQLRNGYLPIHAESAKLQKMREPSNVPAFFE